MKIYIKSPMVKFSTELATNRNLLQCTEKKMNWAYSGLRRPLIDSFVKIMVGIIFVEEKESES